MYFVIAAFERSVAILDASKSDPTVGAEARFGLARALWESRGDRRRARELAATARTVYAEAGPRVEQELAEVDAWLAAHGR